MARCISRYLLLALILSELLIGCNPSSPLTCSDPLGCIPIPPSKPVRIGYILSLTGVAQSFGWDILNGIELAIDDYQAQLWGHPIELSGEDAGCSSEEIQKAATNMTFHNDMLGIIGPHCSAPFENAAFTISNAGMIAIPLMAAAISLPGGDKDSIPGIIGLTVEPYFQGQVAADFTYVQLGIHRVALLHDGSSYSDTLEQAYKEHFQNLGGVITYEGLVDPNTVDMHAILDTIQMDPPGAIYFPIFERSADYLVLQKAEFAALQEQTLITSDENLVDSFFKHIGKAAQDIYLSGSDMNSAGYSIFFEKWLVKYHQPPQSTYHLISYEAANLLIEAISKAAELESNGSMLIGRQALREALIEFNEYSGLTGLVTCKKSGFCTTGQQLGIYLHNTSDDFQSQWPPQPVWETNQSQPHNQ